MLDFTVLAHYKAFGMPVWVHDPHRHRHVWANEAAAALWGAQHIDELLTRSYADMTQGALARLAVAMQAHRRGETTQEHWTLYPGGKPTTRVLHGSGILLPSGEQAILFIAEAPTRHDADLLRSAEALLHMASLAAVHRLEDGQVLMRNPSAVLALGPVEGGVCFERLFVDPDQARTVMDEVRGGQSHRSEARLTTRHGPRWYAIDAHPAWDPVLGERVLHLSATDIAELKATQQQLEQARSRAEAANEAKTAFLAHMSHELRTPLNGVLGMLQVAQRSELTDAQRHWLAVAQGSGQLLLTLLNDLLDMSKIEAGRMALESCAFNAQDLVQQTLAPLAVQAQAKGLTLSSRTSPSLPPRLAGDPMRLRQVLFNVVGNAIKFTHRGQVAVSVDAAARSDGGIDLRFEVADTGIGMDPEQVERFFQAFTQGDSSIARRYGGSGLGLTIVRRLVELMGGQVQIDSRAGDGSTVRWFVRCGAAESAA